MIDYEAKARELRDAWCPDYDVYPTVEQIAAALREADEAGAARGAAAEREACIEAVEDVATYSEDERFALGEALVKLRARGAK